MPHGGDVPAGGHVGAVLHAVPQGGKHYRECALTAVVAHDHLAALEGPHLDGSAFAVGRVPEVCPMLRVGTEAGGEIGLSLLCAIGVKPPDPCCLTGIVGRHASQQLRDVQVMQLPDEFTVPAAGVIHCVQEHARHVHVLHLHLVALPGLCACFHTLETASRNQEFLEGAAVEFVQFVVHRRLGPHSVVALTVADVFRAESPHDGFHHFADQVVGDACTALVGEVLALGHHSTLVVAHEVAPLVAVGESLVAQS